VTPKRLLTDFDIDKRGMKFLLSLRDKRADTILSKLAQEFEKDGIRIINSTEFLAPNMAPQKVMTKKKPTKQQKADSRLGFKAAKALAAVDVGQTAVVKDGIVFAVEAFEGTNEAIERGCLLCGEGGVVTKVSKPNQDLRFDVPVVGLDTLKVMKSVGGQALALEAGKVMIVDKDDFRTMAEQFDITVFGIEKA